ncbi:MAG: hypothetical protein WBG30_03830, partial [Psychrilyobacter sp.]|uniref:hypothetical protein n=1 Tax=Psychrilyobacter sp. TaxID=2586924 RepID=UPI003C7551B5
MKGIKYDPIISGKSSAKFIQGNDAIELATLKKEELLIKAKRADEIADNIYNTVLELKNEKNGEELFNVIDLRYFKNKKFEEIKKEIPEIEICTIYRRRKEALRILEDKYLWAVNVVI